MTRKLFSIAMVMILIALTVVNVSAATNKETHKIHVMDYRNGAWYGAMESLDGDHVDPIVLTVKSGDQFEDMLEGYNTVYTGTIALDEYGLTNEITIHTEYGKDTIFTWRNYGTDNDTVELSNIHAVSNWYEGNLNDHGYQFHNGIPVNGMAFLLRSANAYSTYGNGWIVQNGMLIQTAAYNDEAPMHKVYLPVIN